MCGQSPQIKLTDWNGDRDADRIGGMDYGRSLAFARIHLTKTANRLMAVGHGVLGTLRRACKRHLLKQYLTLGFVIVDQAYLWHNPQSVFPRRRFIVAEVERLPGWPPTQTLARA